MGFLEVFVFFIIALIVFLSSSITKAKKEQSNYKKTVINDLIEKNFSYDDLFTWFQPNTQFGDMYSVLAINKKKKLLYIKSRTKNKNQHLPDEVDEIFKLQDIEKVEIRIVKSQNTEIDKKNLSKRAVAGGLLLGTKGALAGALTAQLKETEYLNGYYLTVYFNKSYVNILFANGLNIKRKNVEALNKLIQNSEINNWYDLLNLVGDT